MFTVIYYAANRRETTATAASYSRAMDKASELAIRQAKPFPIVIKDDQGQIIQTIKG